MPLIENEESPPDHRTTPANFDGEQQRGKLLSNEIRFSPSKRKNIKNARIGRGQK